MAEAVTAPRRHQEKGLGGLLEESLLGSGSLRQAPTSLWLLKQLGPQEVNDVAGADQPF